MPTIDLDSLALPVDPDHPAGEDLEYDPLFIEMEQAAAGKPEQQMGSATIEAEEPDWLLVQRNATALLERSKDLRTCVYLCEAALHNAGLEAMSEAMQLASTLTQSLWETLHPELDEDDDNDPTARVNAVMALASPGRLLRPLEQTPLISVPMLGSLCWADVKPASGESEQRQLSDEAQAIIGNCDLEQIAQQRAAVQQALEACQGLETFITAQVGTSRAPNLEPLRTLLKRIDHQLGDWWTQRGGDEPAAADDASEQDDDDSGDLFADSPAAAPAAKAPRSAGGQGRPHGNGAITTRQEAIAAIDRILAYYREHEPSSPLPLLLQRAKRLATKSFMEILQDLAPEGLGRAQELAGLSPHAAATLPDSGAVAEASSGSVVAAAAPAETEEDDDDDFFS